MISRLPRWVWGGGAILAVVGGMINAVGFLSFQRQGVTHLTGTTTLLGIAVAQGNAPQFLRLISIVLAFFTGATFSGFLIKDSTLQLGRRYGLALVAESALLFLAIPFLRHGDPFGALLASTACGLQNGMVSTYSGAVVRTTHVSGIVTDLGIFTGQLMNGVPVDIRRIKLGAILLLSFFIGAVLGAVAFARYDYGTLYFPAAFTGVVGFAYGTYRHRQLKK